MKRRVLNLLTALSLLLCVAAVTLWVRSYRRTAAILWSAHETTGPRGRENVWVQDRWAEAWRGVVVLYNRRWPYAHDGMFLLVVIPAPGWRWESEPASRMPPLRWLDWRSNPPRHGFAFSRGASPLSEWRIAVPLWSLALAPAALPTIRLLRLLRRRGRLHSGRCASCGYDLHATPDRCPECGTAAPVPAGTIGA